MIKKIAFLLSVKDKKMLALLLLMSLFLSIIETIGISAIMPFIAMASDPEFILENKYLSFIYHFFQTENYDLFIIYFGFFLILFYIFRAVYILVHGYMLNKFAMNKYGVLANKLFESYLNMPYSAFVNTNSATISKAIITEAAQLALIFKNILIIVSEVLVIILLYILLLMTDVSMTIVLTIFIGFKILLLKFTISKKIKKEGVKREVIQKRFYQKVNEMIGNFKMIKFVSNQRTLLQNFSSDSVKYKDVQVINATLLLVPRTLLEATGLLIIVGVVVYMVAFGSNSSNFISIISMYALALYRILPAVSRILDNYNNALFYTSSIEVVYNNLSRVYKKELGNVISFNETIEVVNMSFTYNNVNVINNLSLTINKGDRVAFIGASGSGKSTLVDLISGIYSPDKGEILIDNIKLDYSNIASWRKKIGYIPQSIYLFDGTIAENIVSGRIYNEIKLIKLLKQTSVYNFIMKKDGLNTMVGEGGIQLSGGQKQRIGIARALYGDPEILVLDEATSALDSAIEKEIMDEIYRSSKDKTLIIIAHRLSTIERCDFKINLNEVV
jgi:ATP-binding cassette, subfamily B, bacterial PglK